MAERKKETERRSIVRHVVEDSRVKELKPVKHNDRVIRLDRAGYFLIKINRKTGKIMLGVCDYTNRVRFRISSEEPKDIIATVMRHNLITLMEHAAYLGRELEKARLALKLGYEYVQDSDLQKGVKKKRIGPLLFYARRVPGDIKRALEKSKIRYDKVKMNREALQDMRRLSGQKREPVMVSNLKVVVGWPAIRRFIREALE